LRHDTSFHIWYKFAAVQVQYIGVGMKFSIRFADKIVGFLVVLALVILIFVILMIGRSQRWFIQDSEYKTFLNSASGVSMNMAVLYKGFTIGHVKKIMLTSDDRVEVIFSIFDEHSLRVRVGSMVEILASPIGLGNSFIFHPGNGTEQLEAGSLIPEINSLEARFLIDTGLASAVVTNDGISNIINQANALLETINLSIAGTNPSEPTLGQILGGINELVNTINIQLNPILNNLDSATGKISNPAIYSELSTSLNSINGILGNLEKTSDFMPSNVPALMADLNAALATLQDVLVALTNNPLLRRGVPEHRESSPGGANSRDLEF